MSIIEEQKLEFGIGSKNGFKEIVQRHESRFEVPYKMDSILEKTDIFKLVSPYAYRILGENAHVVNCSLVISRPGSSNQAWHVDGPHLSTEKYLPCHILNIFVPLIDMSAELGPTEFRPNSQYLTRNLSKMYMAAFMKKQLEKVEAPILKKGSIVMVSVVT
jgi:ectoine hydroxylase-related dioxygenase (phytanoyl-CoA dioxygenase family)